MKVKRFFMKKVRFKPRYRRSPKKPRAMRAALVFLLCVISCAALFISAFDKKLAPTVLEIARIKGITKINSVIDSSIREAVTRQGIASEDFYEKSVDVNGAVQSLSINTMLVNEICSKLSASISESLISIGEEKISVPIGSVSGIEMFSNYGPRYTFKVLPYGNAYVDYSSNFTDSGINQIKFEIWLTIDAKIKIVNPLKSFNIDVSRKVLLVSAIIAGDVPPVYLNGY